MYALALHGGAGAIQKHRMTEEERSAYESALKRCLALGEEVLIKKGSALDAVAACVTALEDEPLFNAGRGSVLNSAGEVEMDASIMCGQTLKAGGASLIQRVKNPILLAKAVMEKTPHILLAGLRAEEFARLMDLEFRDSAYFITQRRHEQLEKARQAQVINLDHDDPDQTGNTVGAVARDSQGNLAAATSTGGLTMKLPGRVSDSSIIGAGTYANNKTCAISTTGTGDLFILHSIAATIHNQMEFANRTLEEACAEALARVGKSGGTGGLIAVSAAGEIVTPFISSGMFRAQVREGEPVQTGM